jgi:hypothetical protein
VQIRVTLTFLRRRIGDLAGSAAALADAEEEAARLGLPTALSTVAFVKGDLARWDGDLPAAHEHLTRAVAIARNITVPPQLRATSLDSLGYVAAASGDLARARTYHAEALDRAMESIDAPMVAHVMVASRTWLCTRATPRRRRHCCTRPSPSAAPPTCPARTPPRSRPRPAPLLATTSSRKRPARATTPP